MSKKSRKVRSPKPRQETPEGVRFVEYEITSETIQDRRYQQLPEYVKDTIDRLHFEAQRKPRQAIPELEKLVETYPDIPVLYNYLGVAYSLSGNQQKAEEIVLENIKRNPNYLFARLNYAEICLAKHEYKKVKEIFDNKLELSLLYPHRKRFHTSEVIGFMSVIGRYLLGIGERDAAEKYYELLKKISPDSLQTKQLGKLLHPNLLVRLLSHLFPPNSR